MVCNGVKPLIDLQQKVFILIKLVDHALSRVVHKGLLALIDVEGTPEPEIFNPSPRE